MQIQRIIKAMKKLKRNVVLTAAPATTSQTVKDSQVQPDICPRDKEFGDKLEKIHELLLPLVKANSEEYAPVLLTGSGTSAMEAVLTSVVTTGKVLIIENGAYGKRFYEIAEAHRVPHYRLVFEWGTPLNFSIIEEYLKQKEDISAVCVIHHETTSGILNDVERLGQLCKQYSKTYIIDTISSIAGKEIDIKKIGADYVLGSSNKCIQAMPGIAFVICKLSSLLSLSYRDSKAYYLNLYKNFEYFKAKRQTCFTPAMTIIYSLYQALIELYEEGLTNRIQRYENCWKTLNEGMKKLGFKKILQDNQESKLVTSYLEPEGFDFNKVYEDLKSLGFIIYPGKLLNIKTFRVGNIGDITEKDILDFLKTFGDVIC